MHVAVKKIKNIFSKKPPEITTEVYSHLEKYNNRVPNYYDDYYYVMFKQYTIMLLQYTRLLQKDFLQNIYNVELWSFIMQ